jgi:hypothetical protein
MITLIAITVGFLAMLRIEAVTALPNVTVVPMGRTDCMYWPGWINKNETDTTGPIQFQIDQSEDVASDGLIANHLFTTYENGCTTAVSTVGLRINKSKLIGAYHYYRCFKGEIYLLDANDSESALRQPLCVDTAPGGYRDTPLLGSTPVQGSMVFRTGLRLEPYWHEENGVRQQGIYLGANNLTTWAFSYWTSGCGIGHIRVRFLGLPGSSRIEEGLEFKGFLKIVKN